MEISTTHDDQQTGMKDAVFTIVAKNYIGLAQVLGKSLGENTDADFFIFVADEFDGNKPVLPPNIVVAKTNVGIETTLWVEMSFKYSLVEFCTAIKPYCFSFLFDQKKYNKAIYLDPDVFVFNSLKPVFADLEKYSIVLTPHIVDMEIPFKGAYADYLFLVNGTFNLGFMAVRNSRDGNKMISWWKDRLNDQCFFDNDRGMATDQKWINLLPSFFDSGVLKICFDKGLNVAPWNYHERKIVVQDGQLFVTERNESAGSATPLMFAHFSGYDYKSFAIDRISHKNAEANAFPDLKDLFEKYTSALKDDCFQKFLNLTYTYNTYENGKNIISLHRRIFRRLLDENYSFSDPFHTGQGSFYEGLKKRRLIDHSPSSADKITNKTVPGFNKKVKWVNWLFRSIQRIVGVHKYSIFIRFFRRYFKEENQAFLLDKNMTGNLW